MVSQAQDGIVVSDMMDVFNNGLRRVHRQWRRGLYGVWLLEVAGWAGILMAVACWSDLLMAWNDTMRMVLAISVLVLIVAAAIRGLAGFAGCGMREAARHADTQLASRRREILTAYELVHESGEAPTGLERYLVDACVAVAALRLAQLPDARPHDRIRAAWRRLGLRLAVSWGPAVLAPAVAWVLLGRLFMPGADIPPYSRYRFDIQPEQPQVIYGSDQVLTVTIRGARVRRPVHFVTRQGNRIQQTLCFQADATTFVQRVERVMHPLEFTFMTGRARSRWHRLDVLMQPQITTARIRVVPPAYSRRQTREADLGNEPVQDLKGTRLELRVASNRPLKGGTLSFRASGSTGLVYQVEARPVGRNEVQFDWTLDRSATVEAVIRDILGTACRAPLTLRQKLVPDELPEPVIHEPAQYALATPDIRVPVTGSVRDDIGLHRVELLRALTGYRDRALTMPMDEGSVSCTVTGCLDLARLGVEPGQVVELALEAMDNNPQLTGIGVSDVVRLQIISAAEYADIMQAQTTLEAFSARFAQLAEGREALARALAEAQKQEARAPGSEAAAQAWETVKQQTAEWSQQVAMVASEFAAFDLEKQLQNTAAEMQSKLQALQERSDWSAGGTGAREALADLLGAGGKDLQSVLDQAGDAERIGRIMQCAAWFRGLYERQEMVVRRLNRYVAGEHELVSLDMLGQTQAEIRRELIALTNQLASSVGEIPETYPELRDSVLEFLGILQELDIPAPMQLCSDACRNQSGRDAYDHALRALELMSQLLSRCKGNAMGGLCDGALRFKIPGELGSTMSQLLKSLMGQFATGVGIGEAGSAGTGMMGVGDGGYRAGRSPVNVPVYGPFRRDPATLSTGGASGNGRGPAGGAGGLDQPGVLERVEDRNVSAPAGEGIELEQVPQRYREAVKRFYAEEQP